MVGYGHRFSFLALHVFVPTIRMFKQDKNFNNYIIAIINVCPVSCYSIFLYCSLFCWFLKLISLFLMHHSDLFRYSVNAVGRSKNPKNREKIPGKSLDWKQNENPSSNVLTLFLCWNCLTNSWLMYFARILRLKIAPAILMLLAKINLVCIYQ